MKKTLISVAVLLIFATTIVFADLDDYFFWTHSINTMDIEVVLRDPKYYSELYEVYDDWNGIDSKIHFSNMTYSPTIDSNFTVQTYDLPGTVVGRCEIYDYVLGLYYIKQDIASFSGSVDKVKILLDTDVLPTLGPDGIKRTITHELGHAIGLSHPDDGERDYCIMQQTKSYYDSLTIQPHDEDNLRAKW